MSNTDITYTETSMSLKKFITVVPNRYFLKIHHVYNLTVDPSWKIQERRTADLHLLFVKGGRGTYWMNGREESLHRGKVIFVSNQFPHSGLPDSSNLPSIIPVRFGVYDILSGQPVSLFPKPFYHAAKPDHYAEYQDCFEQLHQTSLKTNMLGREQICGGILYEIMARLLHDLIHRNEQRHDLRIKRAKHILDDKADHSLSLHSLASQTDLSVKQLTRLFAKHYGATPKQYLIKRIIQKADYLLHDTTMSIGDIAQALGYPDPYSFSKQYKQVSGRSPIQARRHTDE